MKHARMLEEDEPWLLVHVCSTTVQVMHALMLRSTHLPITYMSRREGLAPRMPAHSKTSAPREVVERLASGYAEFVLLVRQRLRQVAPGIQQSR